jgi:ABC-type branched-subunit amino acid transport system substrate-binding protein
MLVAEAIRARGADRAAVRDQLAQLGESNAFRGVTGPIYFRESGDPVGRQFAMTRVRGGALVTGGGR